MNRKHGMSRTFVFGGLIQQRRLASQFFVYGDDLPRNGSKLQYNSKEKRWNGTVNSKKKKRPLRRGSVWPVRTMSEAALTLSTAPTESVNGVGSLSTVCFQEWNRGFSSPGGVVDY